MSDAMVARAGAGSIADTPAQVGQRRLAGVVFQVVGIAATLIGLLTLVLLMVDLIGDGWHVLRPDYFLNYPSRDASIAGILPGWVGSILVIITTAAIAIPIGVMAGLYLEEYAPRNLITSSIEIAVNNLAAVPSIIFGLLALGLFVQVLGFGRTIFTGGVTLGLLILPIVIVATREAVRSVPRDLRQAALALGATKWQTTSHHVLPSAMPGVVTGVIIGMSRAIGETAPLIVIGGLSFAAFLPFTLPGDTMSRPVGAVDQYLIPLEPNGSQTVTLPDGGLAVLPDGFTKQEIPANTPVELPNGTMIETPATLADAAPSWLPSGWLDEAFTALPIQMFNWTQRPEPEFRELAAAAGFVLFAITLIMNGLAIWLRYRLRKRLNW
jgi:phosphate transport system permease protein